MWWWRHLNHSLTRRSQDVITNDVKVSTVAVSIVLKTNAGLSALRRASRSRSSQNSNVVRLGGRPRWPSRLGAGAARSSKPLDCPAPLTDNSMVCPPLAATRKPAFVQCQAILSTAYRIACPCLPRYRGCCQA